MSNRAIDILKSNEADILGDWLQDLQNAGWARAGGSRTATGKAMRANSCT